MGYKMKGFSGFKQSCGCDGKCMCSSPLKQEKKVPGSDWNMDDYLVDGKPAREIVKEHHQKERDKWNQDLINLREKYPKSTKKKKLDHIGTGFMNPPHKDTVKLQKLGVPYEKRQGYHGFKNSDSILSQSQDKSKKKDKTPLKMHNGVPHWKSNPKFRRDGTLKKVVTRDNKACKDCEPYKSVIRFDKSGHIKSARNSETKNKYKKSTQRLSKAKWIKRDMTPYQDLGGKKW